jgi:hypothetical protein
MLVKVRPDACIATAFGFCEIDIKIDTHANLLRYLSIKNQNFVCQKNLDREFLT